MAHREVKFPVRNIDGEELCFYCSGSGICPYCGGTGNHPKHSYERENCKDGKCRPCGGTGWTA